jgi:hypothetical protein
VDQYRDWMFTVKRAVAAALSVVLATGIGVVTNLVTQRWGIALGAGLGVLVLLGCAVQVYLVAGERGERRERSGVRQQAVARGRGVVIQAGRDAHVDPVQRGAADD